MIKVPVVIPCTCLLSKLAKTNKAKLNKFLLTSSIPAGAEKSGLVTKLISHLWLGFESWGELFLFKQLLLRCFKLLCWPLLSTLINHLPRELSEDYVGVWRVSYLGFLIRLVISTSLLRIMKLSQLITHSIAWLDYIKKWFSAILLALCIYLHHYFRF